MKKGVIVIVVVTVLSAPAFAERLHNHPSPVYFGVGVQGHTSLHIFPNQTQDSTIFLGWISFLMSMELDILFDLGYQFNARNAIGVEGFIGRQILHAYAWGFNWGVNLFGRFDVGKRFFLQPYAGVYAAVPDYWGYLHDVTDWDNVLDARLDPGYYASIGTKLGWQLKIVDLYFILGGRFRDDFHFTLGFGATVHFFK
jgi:hypothetical protein